MSDVIWRGKSTDANAYGRPVQEPNDQLTQVGPGTEMGELLRRYWQPIAKSDELTDLPKMVGLLGEEFVLFRDRNGNPGLLYPRCMHRGTSLYYGKVENRGIRCCYHGWLFDTEGRCLEQPCEPNEGKHLDAVRQPWHPVEERYGLIFAYLGPPEKKPVLPRYDNLENLGPDEMLFTILGGFGATGDDSFDVLPYSWLQMNDNVMDPFHVQVLHTTLSGPQFAPEFGVMPTADFFHSDYGVCYSAVRDLDDGRQVDRISAWFMPNIMSVPDVTLREGKAKNIAWMVPVDDSHFFQAVIIRVPKGFDLATLPMRDKKWKDMSDEEHQRIPGDFEAQAGQGPISLHSEEHLVTGDRGILMQRTLLRQGMKTVAEGGDPLNVFFDNAQSTVNTPSGNYYKK